MFYLHPERQNDLDVRWTRFSFGPGSPPAFCGFVREVRRRVLFSFLLLVPTKGHRLISHMPSAGFFNLFRIIASSCRFRTPPHTHPCPPFLSSFSSSLRSSPYPAVLYSYLRVVPSYLSCLCGKAWLELLGTKKLVRRVTAGQVTPSPVLVVVVHGQ